MPLSYGPRLLVLCCAVFCAAQACVAAGVGLLAPSILRRAERLTPRRATRELLLSRMAPAAVALLAVFGLCLPSYLWLEPAAGLEHIGWPVLLAAVATVLGLSGTAWRLGQALRSTRRQAVWGNRLGQAWRHSAAGIPSLRLAVPEPILAVHGFRRPQLWISDGVLAGLRGGQLVAALRHERAHARRRDNLARLALNLLPHWLPSLPVAPSLQSAWERLTEWAADDEAAAGSRRRALDLAAALVCVARLGNHSPAAAWGHPLLGSGDFESRVLRLTQPIAPAPAQPLQLLQLLPAALLALSLAATLSLPVTQHAVHALLEVLVH